jgi:hypothetical protein
MTLNPFHEYLGETQAAFEEVEPAGAVFEDTAKDAAMPMADRQLLAFAGTGNVVACRWLLRFSASALTEDPNGTTALHAACRTGSRTVIKDLCMVGDVSARDRKGWTPLHVAVWMGRRDIVAFLLSARADPTIKTAKGQTAADVCFSNDTAMKKALNNQYHLDEPRIVEKPGSARLLGAEGETPRGPTDTSRFEPFFVPRTPFTSKPDPAAARHLETVGIAIFNRDPGRGISFLTSTGLVRDFPIQISSFLHTAPVDPVQLGSILGQEYSLSQILLVEFINSAKLAGTGVVGCLTKVFQEQFAIPHSLPELDRIMQALARMWWRHHERPVTSALGSSKPFDEACGEELKLAVRSSECLYLLLFSSALQYWSLTAAQSSPKANVTLEQWIGMNKGIMEGKDVPRDVQEKIYRALQKADLPNLMMAGPLGPRLGGNWTPRQPTLARGGDALSSTIETEIEGWLEMLDINSVTSRLDQFVRLGSPTLGEFTRKPNAGLMTGRPNFVWMTVGNGLVFISPKPLKDGGVPCALISCYQIQCTASTHPDVVTITPQTDPGQIAALQTDGRFQVLPFSSMRLKPEGGNAEKWSKHMARERDKYFNL